MTRMSETMRKSLDAGRLAGRIHIGSSAANSQSAAEFFDKRGGLDLSRDRSSHRRFTYLYDDLLQ